MSFFDNVVGKIFGKQSSKVAFIHEQLSRTEKELAQYQAWVESEESESMLIDFDRAYHLKKKQIASQMEVHLLESRYSNGFAITFNQVFTPISFQNFFDYLKDKTLEQGYKLAQSDRRIMDKDTYEETIEKWYLKPQSADLDTSLINQRFGNIIIEKIEVNRKPNYLRFMANIYADRLYSKAQPFDELFDKLTSK